MTLTAHHLQPRRCSGAWACVRRGRIISNGRGWSGVGVSDSSDGRPGREGRGRGRVGPPLRGGTLGEGEGPLGRGYLGGRWRGGTRLCAEVPGELGRYMSPL